MGLFDFLSDAGDKATETVEVSPERVNKLREENIGRMVAQLDVDGEAVSVKVNGDKAVLTGTAPTQEAMEKIVLCAGNQFGIAQVDCQMKVDEPEAVESTFYTVKAGDTLGKIAQAQYGSAGKYTVIFEANKPMLTDPDKIYPGQSLRIPPL
ncbi:MAG: peptidoglycan-binding protein LysM [Pseudomonadales bacterium]|nr:peptidoglycan-binding protein LysM [Halioglobus sp.]MCP5131387.1 peptidoglycan-binding protein LysM [Pseudomonadales bacterium]